MDELHFSWNKLSEEEMVHLSKCIHKVKRLYILKCDLASNGMKDLSDAIMKLDEPVRILLNVSESLN